MQKFIIRLYKELTNRGLEVSLGRLTGMFYDEPKPYYYNAITRYRGEKKYHVGSHLSFFSREKALLKAIAESMERVCILSPVRSNIIVGSYNKLRDKENKICLDPALYKKNAGGEKFGWVRGSNLTTGKKCFIPAQLVFLNYFKDKTVLTNFMTTGCAAGFDEIGTKLRALYEVIERDSTMTIYLAKIPRAKINLRLIKDRRLKIILENFDRYRLELSVFDVTNDLEVPAFLAVIEDKTGFGPYLAVGSKASFDMIEAIIGAIEESLMTRSYLKSTLSQKNLSYQKIKEKDIVDQISRLTYWSDPEKEKHLWFLLKQPLTELKYSNKSFKNPTDEFDYLIKKLKEKKYEVFFVDITQPLTKKIEYFCLKVIIPKLQPLYLDERIKEVRIERIETVSKYFGIKKAVINDIPHPLP